MEKYKIIDVLRSFSKKDLRRFNEFVKSPFFNKNNNNVRLLDSLSKFHPAFSGRKLNTENIFREIFPGEAFNYKKLNNIISDLYLLAERFLIQTDFESGEKCNKKGLLKQLRLKQLYRIYEQVYAAYLKKLVSQKYVDEEHFLRLYELNDEYLWYATIKKPNTELNILQAEFDNFIKYALTRILRFYSLMLHEKNQSNVSYNLTFFREITEHMKKNNYHEPIINLFATTVFLLETKDVKYYTELKTIKEKFFKSFSFEVQELIHIHLYDYAAYMVNFKCDDSYNRDMFEIHYEMINEKFINPNRLLFPNFMNIVKIACRVGEYDYTEKFIRDFSASIPENEKTNVLNFCYGTLEFYKGNFNEALRCLSKTNFRNFIFKVQVKILHLQICYKLGLTEQALTAIDTFRHYLSREENLLNEHREAYGMFLKLVSEMINLIETKNKKTMGFEKQRLIKETEKMPSNPFRIKVWLLEELNRK